MCISAIKNKVVASETVFIILDGAAAHEPLLPGSRGRQQYTMHTSFSTRCFWLSIPLRLNGSLLLRLGTDRFGGLSRTLSWTASHENKPPHIHREGGWSKHGGAILWCAHAHVCVCVCVCV